MSDGLNDIDRCDHCRKTDAPIALVGGRTTCYDCIDLSRRVKIHHGKVFRGAGDTLVAERRYATCVLCEEPIDMPNELSNYGRHHICIGCVYLMEAFACWTKRLRHSPALSCQYWCKT